MTGFSLASDSTVVSRETLVAGDRHGLAGGVGVAVDLHRVDDGHDLAVEAALRPGDRSLLLGCRAELVEVGAGESTTFGHTLGCAELAVGRIVPRPGVVLVVAPAATGGGAEGDLGHLLHAAADRDAGTTGGDEAHGEGVRLCARAALAVDRRRSRAVVDAHREPGVAGDVGGLLAGLGDAAAHELIDLAGFDPVALEQCGLGDREQLRGLGAGEPASAPPDGRADGVDDDGIGHDGSSRWAI